MRVRVRERERGRVGDKVLGGLPGSIPTPPLSFVQGLFPVEGMPRGRLEGWGCYIRPARGGESSVRPREAYRSRRCDDRSRDSHGARDLSSTHDARACPREQKAPSTCATARLRGPRRDSRCFPPLLGSREPVQPRW